MQFISCFYLTELFFAYFIESVLSLFNLESQALDWLHISSALCNGGKKDIDLHSIPKAWKDLC